MKGYYKHGRNILKLKFRDALRADLENIVEIYNSTIPSRTVTADTEIVSVESKQKWFDEHNPSKRPLWVVENELNEIIRINRIINDTFLPFNPETRCIASLLWLL